MPAPVVLAQFEVLREPVVLPDGGIMAIGIQSRNGTQQVTARFSRDEGASWSGSQVLFQLPRTAGRFGYYRVMIDRRGELHVFFLCQPPPPAAEPGNGPRTGAKETLDIWQVKSRQGRMSWDPPNRIWEGRGGDLVSAIQLASGRMLLPISYRTDRTWRRRGPDFAAFTYTGSFASGMLYSDDDGETWRESPSVLRVPAPDLGTIGGVEPVVLQLKDGRVWMLIRTEMGRFYESFSSDGARWSPPQPSPIVSSESPAGLVRLNAGRILLLVNDCERFPYAYGGRHVLHGAISEDEGRTWHGYREVARDPLRNEPPPPGGDFGVAYPFPALTHGGKVIFSLGVTSGTRSQTPEGWNVASREEKRSMMLLDPSWLDQTSQRTDFSQGLDDWSIFGTKGVGLGSDPDGTGAPVLRISKPDATWPAGAVWNFPAGQSGKLHLRLLLKTGFQGALLGLTDHFSVPWDPEDEFFNVFNFELDPDREPRLAGKPAQGRWHDLQFEWNCRKRECRVTIDGGLPQILYQQRIPQSQGLCYLRLHSRARFTDPAGMLVGSVAVDVSRQRPN